MSFYITTPIYYVNSEPHHGHAYTTIAADVLARHHRQRGEDVFFLTGTDEHGTKIAQAAEERGLTPQQHVDQMAPKYRALAAAVGASNDFFIRTTDPEHEKFVQGFVEKLKAAGDIEKRSLRRPLLHGVRGLLVRARPHARGAVPAARHQAHVAGGGELLLPAQQVPGQAGGLLQGEPRLREAEVALQRGPLVHRAGPRRHQHQPLQHHLGRARALGRGAGHLRVGRRAHQLPERAHVRAPG